MIGYVVFSAAAALTLSAIAFASHRTRSDAPFKLTSLKLFGDPTTPTDDRQGAPEVDPKGELVSPGSELAGYAFPETQKAHRLRFNFSPGSEGKPIHLVLFGAKTTLGLEKKVTEVTSAISASGDLEVQVASNSNWPVGIYRVELSCEGKTVGLSAYQVKAVTDRTQPVTLQRVTIYTLEFGRGVIRSEPKTADRYLEFHAATAGAKTAGASVTWKLSILNDDGITQHELRSQIITNWPLENTVLVHQVELPTDWRAGSYLLEYWVDDLFVGRHPFTIKR